MAATQTTNGQSSSMQGGEGGVTTTYPWLKCIAGCKVNEEEEIILLECLHSICSDECFSKLLSEVKPGQPYICSICKTKVGREGLAWKKIVPRQEFAKKAATIKEPTLICDNCFAGDPAVCYCVDCPALLCGRCEEFHPQFKPTHHHALKKDLSEQKALRMAKAEEVAGKCNVHETELLTHVCINCQQKICEQCIVLQHKQHDVVDSKKEKELLTATIDLTRIVERKSNLAVTQMKKEQETILPGEWETVMLEINNQFAMMMNVLRIRQTEVTNDAKAKFLKQLGELKTKASETELVALCAGEFLKAAESVISDMDDVSNSNFLRHSQSYRQLMVEMEKKLRLDFDQFVNKPLIRHFQTDSAANILARNFIQQYCQVEYNCQPRIPTVILKTYSSVAKMEAKTANSHDATISAETINSSKTPKASTDDTPSQRVVLRNRQSAFDMERGALSGIVARRTCSQGDNFVSPPRALTPDLPEREDMTATTSVLQNDSAAEDNITNPPALRTSSEARNASETQLHKKSKPDSPSPPSDICGQGLGKRVRKKKTLPPGFVETGLGLKQRQAQEATSAASPAFAIVTRLEHEAPTCSDLGPSNCKKPRSQSDPAHDKNDGKAEVCLDIYGQSGENDDKSTGYDDSCQPGPSVRRQPVRMRKVPRKFLFGEQKQETIEECLSGDELAIRDGKGKLRTTQPSDNVDLTLPEATRASLEIPPEFCDYPVQGQGVMKVRNEDHNEDYCCICLDGGDIFVCCDYCPKVFHLGCHIPNLNAVPDGDENEKWRCNYDTTKEMIEELIANYPVEDGSENKALVPTNKRHFVVACKFVMECYKIDEIPTMRWKFPNGYVIKYRRVPYHLKYIRERLCAGVPTHFTSVKDMLIAFCQMFGQAFAYYRNDKNMKHARTCFVKFLSLVEDYYPAYRDLFNEIE